MKDIIKLEATIDLTKGNGETTVKPINDIWMDFGYWLEVTGFMAYQAMNYREWTEQQMVEYINQYFLKTLRDYKLPPIV